MRKVGEGLLAAAACAALACQHYSPKPLAAAAPAPALPEAGALRVEAASLRHPLLPPIEVDLADGLSPDEAAVVAVLVNPGLRAVRDRRGLADAQLLSAGILPAPQLGAGFDAPTGGATAGTVDAWAGSLSWDLAGLLGRSARRAAARAGRAAVELDIAWEEWQVAEGAKAAVYRWASHLHLEALAAEADRLLAENLDLVRRAVDRHLLTEPELAAAEAASRRAHAGLLAAREEAEKERLALLAILGLPPHAALPLAEGVEAPERFEPPAADRLDDGLERRRLDLAALRLGYQAQEATLHAAILAQFPRIGLGVNVARDTGDVVTTGLAITLDLPLFDRNRGPIATERATRQQLFDEYADRLFQARADVAALVAAIASLNRRIAAARAAEPAFEHLVETYRRAVRNGDADALSYYTAWGDLVNQRIETLTLRRQLAEARIALEIAAGAYRLDTLAEPGPSTEPAPGGAG